VVLNGLLVALAAVGKCLNQTLQGAARIGLGQFGHVMGHAKNVGNIASQVDATLDIGLPQAIKRRIEQRRKGGGVSDVHFYQGPIERTQHPRVRCLCGVPGTPANQQRQIHPLPQPLHPCLQRFVPHQHADALHRLNHRENPFFTGNPDLKSPFAASLA